MQFVIIAYDDTSNGLNKRLASRDKHIEIGDKLKSEGKYHMGVAILDDNDQMIGSIMIVDFPSRNELNEYLKIEPYVTGEVWKDIKIIPCKIGPSFTK